LAEGEFSKFSISPERNYLVALKEGPRIAPSAGKTIGHYRLHTLVLFDLRGRPAPVSGIGICFWKGE
jgi:hypothetical protein